MNKFSEGFRDGARAAGYIAAAGIVKEAGEVTLGAWHRRQDKSPDSPTGVVRTATNSAFTRIGEIVIMTTIGAIVAGLTKRKEDSKK